MAKTYDMSEEFIRYQEEIASSPVYAGMPDLRNEDGTIQWEAPSNRTSGIHRDTHDKRLQWWKDKASTVGINTSENKWISKTAKQIHPTKVRPCKVCGQYMDIRYCYLSSNLLKRLKKHGYDTDKLGLSDTTSIFDLITLLHDTCGNKIFAVLPELLSCKAVPKIPEIEASVESWIAWIEREYIPKEPSLLGPGAMSNAPDRLDGFHSFNRCCRASADKGRSKQNLASYTTDRRAFEYWSDGNWITANKLMGIINSRPDMRIRACLHDGSGGVHPRPCSADHIGPISLGFAHRPSFQLLCKPCNSAKNNRLYYSDVQNLIAAEKNGENVATWYAKPIWDKLKDRVNNNDDALRLYRIMRDNRYNAMNLLGKLLNDHEHILLFSLLNLDYVDYTYSIESVNVNNHIVTAIFDRTKSNQKYVSIQKARKVRIAFSSLGEYLTKNNRNGLAVNLSANEDLYKKLLATTKTLNTTYIKNRKKLVSALSNGSKSKIEAAVNCMPELSGNADLQTAKNLLTQIMTNIANELASKWDDDRYSREISE